MYRFKEVRLPREGGCDAIARRLVEQDFAGELAAERMDDLKLVVTALVDNAFLHGQGQIRLRLLRQNGTIRVGVMDEGDGVTLRLMRNGHRGGGNGLRTVELLSTRWGVLEGSTHVWADLTI